MNGVRECGRVIVVVGGVCTRLESRQQLPSFHFDTRPSRANRASRVVRVSMAPVGLGFCVDASTQVGPLLLCSGERFHTPRGGEEWRVSGFFSSARPARQDSVEVTFEPFHTTTGTSISAASALRRF